MAVDIGGTFTDIVAASDGAVEVLKLPTDYGDLTAPVLQGVMEAAARIRGDAVSTVIHATTVATNALLEGNGARVGLLVTRGFADLLTIGRIRRADPYSLVVERPAPLVPEDLVREIDERVDAAGEVLVPLDVNQARAAAEDLLAAGAQALVVAFLHSYASPSHEHAAVAAITAIAPKGLPVLASYDVMPEPREYERTSTAVIAAYLAPTVRAYVTRLAGRLTDELYVRSLWVMKSSGGLSHADHVVRHPEDLVESGPAAGVIAAAAAARTADIRAAVGFDMGGTTAKAALIMDGTPRLNHEYEVGGATHAGDFLHKGTGHPLRTPVVDLAEIGTGGGSIAWLDRAGVLRLGPHSAASTPGPACYDRGGTLPTVTDADLVLGYLGTGGLTGLGELRVDLAHKAIRDSIAGPLGIDVTDAAAGIFTLANAQMAEAVRLVSLAKGVDPRDLVLLPSGGAGPVHAWAIARELGMDRVVLSAFPGVASALGLLCADVRSDRSASLRGRAADPVFQGELRRVRRELLDRIVEDLAAQVGGRRDFERHAEAEVRYVGQTYTLAVPVGDTDIAELADRFHEAHESAYGYRSSHDVEVVALRASATQPPLVRLHRAEWRPVGGPAERRMLFDGVEHDVPLVERGQVDEDGLVGPVAVVQQDTTTVVPPGAIVRRLHDDLLELRMGGAR